MLADYPEWTLQEAVYNALEIWGDSRRQYFTSRGHAALERVYRVAEEAAGSLLRSGSSLVADSQHEFGFATFAALSKFESRELLMESLDHAIAYHLNPKLRDKSTRILDLAELVVEEEPPESVARYLRNISRCYVLGLDGEAVVMCRSVLENAIRDAFDRRREVELPDADLETRIRAAVVCHLLDPALEHAAQRVRMRGNKAVHEDPDVTKDVLGTIRSTMRILSDLQAR